MQAAGYRAAFQLADQPQDAPQPLLTVRRVLTLPTWDVPTLLTRMAAPRGPRPPGDGRRAPPDATTGPFDVS